MRIGLEGVNALVTGASSGIGMEIALQLGSSGARVAVHCNSQNEKALEVAGRAGNGSAAFRADLGVRAQVEDLVPRVLEAFGGLDVLVNNAGIFEPSPVELDAGEWSTAWDRTIAVNLTSAAVLCHAALRHFREAGGGRIVSIASRAAFRGETRDYLAYAASKGGMVSLSRSIARSFGKEGVKSFVIAPGFVSTPMCDGVIDEDEVVESELALTEMTRPEHIAPLVVLMASGKMDHATGSSIDVNAGSYMR